MQRAQRESALFFIWFTANPAKQKFFFGSVPWVFNKMRPSESKDVPFLSLFEYNCSIWIARVETIVQSRGAFSP